MHFEHALREWQVWPAQVWMAGNRMLGRLTWTSDRGWDGAARREDELLIHGWRAASSLTL